MHTEFFSNTYNDNFMAFLLKNGLDHSVTNKEGRSLLHIAAQKRNHEQSIMLIEYGADLYLKDNQCITPLDLAQSDYFKYRLEINYKKHQDKFLQIEDSVDLQSPIKKIESKENKDSQSLSLLPIYDVSNDLSIKPQLYNKLSKKPISTIGRIVNELFGIHSSEAHPTVAVVGVSETLMYSSGAMLAAIACNKAAKDNKESRAFSNYSRDYTSFSSEGSYIPAFTGNPMIAGFNTGLFDNPIDQMKFNGIIQTADTRTTMENASSNDNIMSTPATREYTPSWLNNIRMDIDPNAGKPIILVTPIHDSIPPIFITPDESDKILQRGQLPGFIPSDLGIESLPEGFDPYEAKLEDLILFNEETPQSRKCEKGESEIWQELDNYKVIQEKRVKTNSLSGKEKRYYQWDDWHKEIEVYDRHGKPLEVIDPVKGEIIPKSVKKHFEIDL